MKYRTIEYFLKSDRPGNWRYQFRIGRAVKTGRIRTDFEASAIQRVEARVDRELRLAVLDDVTPTGRRMQGAPAVSVQFAKLLSKTNA